VAERVGVFLDFSFELKINLEKRATLSILERVGWAA